jgi:hypothetical protein
MVKVNIFAINEKNSFKINKNEEEEEVKEIRKYFKEYLIVFC